MANDIPVNSSSIAATTTTPTTATNCNVHNHQDDPRARNDGRSSSYDDDNNCKKASSRTASTTGSATQSHHPQQPQQQLTLAQMSLREKRLTLSQISSRDDDDDDDEDNADWNANATTANDEPWGSHSNQSRQRRRASKQVHQTLLQQFRGTHFVDDQERFLLHGYLRIQIVRAQGLRNMDGLRQSAASRGWWRDAWPNSCCCTALPILGNVSDPYVTVQAGMVRLCKTSTVWNCLDPVWREEFIVPVAHYVHHLQFRVKDCDYNLTTELLGTTFLPVTDLIRIPGGDQNSNPPVVVGPSPSTTLQHLRTAVHRTVALDHDPSHGWLEYAVEYIPAHYVASKFVTVPGTYFEPRWHHHDVRLYINADDSNAAAAVAMRRPSGREDASSMSTRKQCTTKSDTAAETTTTTTTTTTGKTGATSTAPISTTARTTPTSTKPPPKVYYGPLSNTAAAKTTTTTTTTHGYAKEWQPQRLWREIYDSLCAAQTLIYMVGWSIDHNQSLLRGEEQRQALERYETKSGYSPILGQLLQQKAEEEGVTVNLMVWDDQTNNLWGVEQGVMKTHDEALRLYFRNSKVNVLLTPIAARHLNPFIGIRNAVTSTHHQKMIVCDDSATHELVGYVGGVDLTGGRYEDGTYPLFRTLHTDHKDDFYNGCAAVTAATGGPRQPWHDIHARVTGGAVLLDLVQNFEERWRKQAPTHLATSALVDLVAAGIRLPVVSVKDRPDHDNNASVENEPPLGDGDDESWSCQLFRSIDDRTAKFDAKFMVRKPMNLEETEGIAEVQTIMRDQDDLAVDQKLKQGKERRRKRDRIKVNGKKIRAKLERYFEGDSAAGFSFDRFLNQTRGVSKDASVQEAMIHHIRRAEHCIYIESQYFLSSSHFWSKDTAVRCSNLVAAEITIKICAKIQAGQRFAAYILVPMWSEGIPESKAVQSILHWQYRTMESMYQRIASAIQNKKKASECIGHTFDAEPTDYLNFYCLGQRETPPEGYQTQTSVRQSVNSASELLSRTRRHLVYVHSKMVIVDDAVALIGSANINQRSLDGSRDSEIVLSCWQQKYLADQQDIARGDVHGFRLQCFAHITGVFDESFRHPSSVECVHCVNEIARTNWQKYTSDDTVSDMHPSYVLPYPIAVDIDTGNISAATENGCFPDTNANILGSLTIIPEFLTT